MILNAYCMAGQHGGPLVEPEPGKDLPPGWRYVRVQLTNDKQWVYNPLGPCQILCCPDHHIEGEPELN